MNLTLFKTACLLLGVVMVAGCGGGPPTLADLNDTNIRRLHSCYNMYMNNKGLKGPKSEQELKDFLTNDNTAKALLKRMEIAQADVPGIFTSDRDGQPYKVRWGLSGVADHAIVFEAEGVEGKRMVAFAKPRELDAAEYDGYWSGKIKPDAPGKGAMLAEPEPISADEE